MIKLYLLFFFLFSFAHANEANVVVASNFIRPIKKIIQLFEKETGYKIKLSTGASKSIYTKIKNGAPYDIFLSADEKMPRLLEKEDLATQNSRFTYATGSLVIYQKSLSSLSLKDKLLSANKIAIANPRFAPYGVAAIELLKNLEIYEKVKHKIIQGNNVSQAFQYAHSDTVDFAIIALSQVKQNKLISTKSLVNISKNNYMPIKQQAVILKSAKDNIVVNTFYQFLKSDQSKKIIQSFGYITNEKDL